MIRLLLLHGEGPILDFALRAVVLLPLAFSVLAWLAWWVGRGRYLSLTPTRLVFRAGGALLLFWMMELLAVVLGLALIIAVVSALARYADPNWDWGPAMPICLFIAPTVLLGSAVGWWVRKGPANNQMRRTRRPAQASEPRRGSGCSADRAGE